MTEASIVSQILQWLKAQPQTEARKLWGGGMGHNGDPDIYGCIGGLFFTLEVKQPGKHATELQARRLEEWGRAGAVTAVVHSLEEAQAALEALFYAAHFRL